MPSMQSTADDLTFARRVIADRGWKQHEYGTADGSVCMLGALNEAITGAPGPTYRCDGSGWDRRQRAADLLAEVIRECDGLCSTPSVASWNDKSVRTVDEVLTVYDSAIARAGEQ